METRTKVESPCLEASGNENENSNAPESTEHRMSGKRKLKTSRNKNKRPSPRGEHAGKRRTLVVRRVWVKLSVCRSEQNG